MKTIREVMVELILLEEQAKDQAAAAKTKCRVTPPTHCVDYIQALTEANTYHRIVVMLGQVVRP